MAKTQNRANTKVCNSNTSATAIAPKSVGQSH